MEYQTIIGRKIKSARFSDERKLRDLITENSGKTLASNLTNLKCMEAKGDNSYYFFKTNIILTAKFSDYQSLQRFTEAVYNNGYIIKGSILKEKVAA
ncbi:MAG: hypothetical protein AABW67_06265 [Nanoarchaeota archaeon]